MINQPSGIDIEPSLEWIFECMLTAVFGSPVEIKPGGEFDDVLHRLACDDMERRLQNLKLSLSDAYSSAEETTRALYRVRDGLPTCKEMAERLTPGKIQTTREFLERKGF